MVEYTLFPNCSHWSFVGSAYRRVCSYDPIQFPTGPKVQRVTELLGFQGCVGKLTFEILAVSVFL